MRARALAQPFPVVHLDTDALEATRLLVDRALPGLVVVDQDGLPLFILPGSQVLRFALPDYVETRWTHSAAISTCVPTKITTASTTTSVLAECDHTLSDRPGRATGKRL